MCGIILLFFFFGNRDRSKRLIGLSQSAYIDKVLKRFSMEDSKRGEVKICKVPTYDNAADPLTKPLATTSKA